MGIEAGVAVGERSWGVSVGVGIVTSAGEAPSGEGVMKAGVGGMDLVGGNVPAKIAISGGKVGEDRGAIK